jgi:tetratricopeptide (TPR) repeat protein
MAARDNLNRIYLKTWLTLGVIVFLSTVAFVILSVFGYKESLYHVTYRVSFITSNTMMMLIDNFTVIIIVAMIFCYSLVIGRSDLITNDGTSILFAQVVSRGLYIIIVSTILLFLAGEFLQPVLEKRMSGMRDKSAIARVFREEGDEAYRLIAEKNRNDNWKNSQRRKALENYRKYLEVIQADQVIEGRVRQLTSTLSIEEFNQSRRKRDVVNEEDTSIADTVVFHSDLAEIYFQKKDYITAWYYYQHVVESDTSRRALAKQRINDIKKILAFRDTMKEQGVNELWLDDTEREIRDIYRKKRQASDYRDRGKYQKAYFIYSDILAINPNLRDVIQAKNETFSILKSEAIELSEIESMRMFPGKKDFIFLNGPGQLVHIGRLVNRFNDYYFYDITITMFDDDNRVLSTIKAPYGHVKSSTMFSLYCYSLEDRSVEYYPVKNGVNLDDYMFMMPVDIGFCIIFPMTIVKFNGTPFSACSRLEQPWAGSLFSIEVKGWNRVMKKRKWGQSGLMTVLSKPQSLTRYLDIFYSFA